MIVGRPTWNVFDASGVNFIGEIAVDATLDGKFKFPGPGKYIVELRVQQYGYPEPTIQRQEITIHQLPELNFPDETPLCKGSEALLDAGYGAFYDWKDNPNLTVERYRKIQMPGKYVVTVRHYNGCMNTDSTMVVEKPLPVVVDTVIGKAACGYDNGSIRLIMEKDTSQFRFDWKDMPDNHSNEANGLKGGVYEVVVSSKETGCSLPLKLTVSEENSPEITVKSSITGTICAGTKVTLTADGAGQFLWYTPDSLTTPSIVVEPWKTTTYIVKGYSRDINGNECSAYADVTINVHTYELPDLGGDRNICDGDTVKLDGGANFSAWSWSTGETSRKINVTESNPNLILRITDRNRCNFSDSISIRIKPTPEINLGQDRIVCKGTPVILNGGPADKWEWNTGDTTRTISIISTDVYAVTVWREGCKGSDEVLIRVNSPDSLKIYSVDVKDITCNGAANGSIRIYVKGEGSYYQYSIDDGANYFDNQGLFENLVAGMPYRIRVIEDSVCTVSYDEEITISEPTPIEIDYRLVSPSCDQCEDGEISLIITGGTPPYSILWSTMDSVKRLQHIGLGTYPVWVKDVKGCSLYENIRMEMGHGSYSIPNAFTPNGDGINETWEIPSLKDKPECVVQVFDRRGKMIFESDKGYPVPWDGKDPDKNVVPVGSYFYLIRVIPDSKPYTGTVTVLK
jgi:gliding motility-associated-like protein